MKTASLWLPFGLALALGRAAPGQVIQTQPVWLIDPTPFKTRVREDRARQTRVLENGLARRAPALTVGAAARSFLASLDRGSVRGTSPP